MRWNDGQKTNRGMAEVYQLVVSIVAGRGVFMNICAYPAEQVLLLFARGFTTLHMEQDLAARQVIATRKRSGAVLFQVFFFFGYFAREIGA